MLNLSFLFQISLSMADYCTICLLGAMDRLWFHQIILFSEPNTTLMLSNNLKIPEQPNTLVSTYPPSDALPDEISSAYKSYATPSELDEFNQEDEEAVDYKKSEITRSNSLLLSDRTRPKTMSRSSYSGPMIRLQKTMSCKTLSELELEEVKGFIDLGFKFSRDNLSPITMSIVPGLQRMGRPKKDKAQDEAQFDDDDIYEEDEDELGENDRGVMRPYLSEAWLIQSANSHLLNLKLPRAYATADMKKHLRYWARTVASVIQLES